MGYREHWFPHGMRTATHERLLAVSMLTSISVGALPFAGYCGWMLAGQHMRTVVLQSESARDSARAIGYLSARVPASHQPITEEGCAPCSQ